MIPPNLLPEPYQSQAFIAGGYAACPALASDMDVWICAPPKYSHTLNEVDLRDIVSLHQIRVEILRHLEEQFKAHAHEENETRSGQASTRYHNQNYQVLKVAEIVGHSTRPIHVLVTDAMDVHILLSGFDVSTHQVALTRDGVITGDCWTPITIPPIRLKDNGNTDARMKKIAERYGHSIAG